jgi:hypothetical protein
VTFQNQMAGKRVRWLPRPETVGLCLPPLDFWCFDSRVVRFHHFAGDGEHLRNELVTDAQVAAMCASAFEAAWGRSIDH